MKFDATRQKKLFEARVNDFLQLEYKNFFHIIKMKTEQSKVSGISLENDSNFDFDDISKADDSAQKQLNMLSTPPAHFSRLNLIMIRHTLLICCYTILWICRSHMSLIPNFSRQTAIFGILIHIIIYMMYPLGDNAYKLCCSFMTMRLFNRWLANYMENQTTIIDQITEKNCQADNTICKPSPGIYLKTSTVSSEHEFDKPELQSSKSIPTVVDGISAEFVK